MSAEHDSVLVVRPKLRLHVSASVEALQTEQPARCSMGGGLAHGRRILDSDGAIASSSGKLSSQMR